MINGMREPGFYRELEQVETAAWSDFYIRQNRSMKTPVTSVV